MDHNPFAPQHHQPGPVNSPDNQTPPTPPPVPTFKQNFTQTENPFTIPNAATQEPAQQTYQQPWSFNPQPQPPQPQQFQRPVQPVAPPQPVVPIAPKLPVQPPADLMPQPVVQVLSPRGVEYVFLTISLFTGAIGLISALLVIVNGAAGFESLSFPVALLLVALPVFGWLFLRLKDAEYHNPSLRLDASKRRNTQFIQIISFITCLFTLVGFMTAIFAKLSGNYDTSIIKIFANVLVILVVSGGILAYYWLDEHNS